MQFVGTKQELIADLKNVAEGHRKAARANRMNKPTGYQAAAKHHDSVAYGMEYAISMLERWVQPTKDLIEFKD